MKRTFKQTLVQQNNNISTAGGVPTDSVLLGRIQHLNNRQVSDSRRISAPAIHISFYTQETAADFHTVRQLSNYIR
jgi:hypothetical protein